LRRHAQQCGAGAQEGAADEVTPGDGWIVETQRLVNWSNPVFVTTGCRWGFQAGGQVADIVLASKASRMAS
jgi:lipid-binding SYLF domain-containing protein